MKPKAITTFLRTLFEPGDVFEIRILDAVLPNSNWEHTESGYFDYDHIDDVPNAIANFASYTGVYVTLNPADPSLQARANNRFKKAKSGTTTSNTEIVKRKWLLIDVDPVRPAGISATDSEKEKSFTLATTISEALYVAGWELPIVIDSGNGTQLLYKIDVPADDNGLVRDVLEVLSGASTEKAKVDIAVHNAARISRIAGTWNCKGDSTKTRPHRIAKILTIPDILKITPYEKLQQLILQDEKHSVSATTQHEENFSNEFITTVSDFNKRGDIAPVLEKHGWQLIRESDQQYWLRPGKKQRQSGCNHSATFNGEVFYVFSDNAQPFEPGNGYNRFSAYCVLEHGGDQNAAIDALASHGFGPKYNNENLAGILNQPMKINATIEPDNPKAKAVRDPGPIPERLFEVPGFIGEVMNFSMKNAPYPNRGLAFCGALTMQSYLCGRKVSAAQIRPNIYMLALAASGTGKDYPRKVNTQIMLDIGHLSALGDKFASGQGLADALYLNGAMLFQNDEMDGVLRQINNDRENKSESIPNVLLTLYTSAESTYQMRVKAGKEQAGYIDQPHMTLFGTATPVHFYQSLSQRMLTNGLFSRMMIVDVGSRSRGQQAGNVRHLPESILQTARWWASFQPGSRMANLTSFHPEPLEVSLTPDAKNAAVALQRQGDDEYFTADQRNDEPSRAAWSRLYENAMKLALLYACSSNHEYPVIDISAVKWAQEFAIHQVRRQLFMAHSYVADSQFDADCLKLLRKLREAPSRQLSHSILLKRMKMKHKDFQELIDTLIQRSDVEIISTQTQTGRPGIAYKLIEGEQ